MKTKYAPSQNLSRGHYVQIDDFEMYYEEYGKGFPLILLHGFGGCTQNWHPFTNELSKYYRLIVIDFRGHGHSTNPQEKFTHRKAANDVFLLLEKLKIQQFSAMGMSSGGMTLLHMATSQSSRIISMVLISSTSHFPEQARIIMGRASFKTMPQEVKEMYKECAKRGEKQILQLIAQFNAFSENYDDMNFDNESLSAITARTLIIHGDRDNFFPVEIAENIHHSIPNSKLWIIHNGEHVPVYDPNVPFTSTALRFLVEPQKE
ncbi:Pimeloyl-ACP methyl ester carboxylesterase [Ulvibacter litoralis]|uniref:Pimeloyl-ACP methyl ester carboxylesterase n=1 Tax=Ulvibacter litoralis TaxID=227084 RepID=A0A1G7JN02_9FLAO|nr:alpha/beta hydrolase [Ulvibacter litoralis]SDF26332.1 Pimeloyl-ACP methyl ester carboxylesterase [Ulvibacter litoralis]